MNLNNRVCDFSLATVVSPKSIETMLEADTGGLFKDQNLWQVAQSFYRQADKRGELVALLFAVR